MLLKIRTFGELFQDFLTITDKCNLCKQENNEREGERKREKKAREWIVLNKQEGQSKVLLNGSFQLNQKSISPCFEYQ